MTVHNNKNGRRGGCSLFYSRENNVETFKVFGVPVLSYGKINNRRIIKLFGKRLFKWNKYKAKPFVSHISQVISTTDGADDWQINYLKNYFFSHYATRVENDRDVWLNTITALYLKGEQGFAKRLLLDYVDKFGMDGLADHGFICLFLKQLGKSTPELDKIADLYDKIMKIRNRQRFETIIKNAKSIAIVGRSPILIGKKLGREIDAHDVVIRFNQSDISGKFAQDYGTKMDISFINCHLENTHDESTLCVYKDFRAYRNHDRVQQHIAADTSKNIDIMGFNIKHISWQLSGETELTTGALAIVWVQQILGTLKNVDIYGFAFQDPEKSLHHFDKNCPIDTNYHDMDAEINFLTNFVGENKND